MDFDLEKSVIFETITGSQLYGTSTPESDLDTRGVCVPPRNILLDPFQGFDQADSFPGKDRAIYSLAKFFKLCADANPNIIELLFAPAGTWIKFSPAWFRVLENKHLFISKKARWTFSGYAFSQLNAIKTHRRYFIDPPKEEPTRESFGLTDSPTVSGDALINLLNVKTEYLTSSIQNEVSRERAYRDTKRDWDNYVSWRDNRNTARQALEDRFGYDTKHASHLVRLMSECRELLLTGKITFPLPDAQEILAIRRGKYTYEQIIAIAESQDQEFNDLYTQSMLPHAPYWPEIKGLYFDIIGA